MEERRSSSSPTRTNSVVSVVMAICAMVFLLFVVVFVYLWRSLF